MLGVMQRVLESRVTGAAAEAQSEAAIARRERPQPGAPVATPWLTLTTTSS